MAIKYGTNVSNSLSGTTGADSIYGWDIANAAGDFGPATDNDTLNAAGNDLLQGGGGDDRLYGGRGHDTLLGGTGDDLIGFDGAGSDNVLDGGEGIDTLWTGVTGTFSVMALKAGIVLDDGTVLRNFERANLTGSTVADSLTGGNFDDTMYGLAGNDTLRGGDGNDLMTGDQGADQLFGGNGEDTITVYGSFDADVVRGGLGIDLLDYVPGQLAVDDVTLVLGYTVTLPDGTVATGFERLNYRGTDAADVVTGGNWDDRLFGGDRGADVLTGRDGNDFLSASTYAPFAEAVTLYGGAGDDTLAAQLLDGTLLSGGAGNDVAQLDFSTTLVGLHLAASDLGAGYVTAEGATIKGIEQISIIGSQVTDVISGGALDDTLIGYFGDDSLSGGAGNDVLDGGRGNDTLVGGDGGDVLVESQGVNVMFGAGGDDRISVVTTIQKGQFMYGGAGDDSLSGGLLADVLNGGAGSDVLLGRTGADRFTFNIAPVAGEVDVIRDFAPGVDKIILAASAFDGLAAGDLSADDFVLGTAARDASDRILYDAATGAVWYDADGKGGVAAVQFLTFANLADLGADDVLIV